MLTKFALETVVTLVTIINLKNIITLLTVHNTFLNVIVIITETQGHNKDKGMKPLLSDESTTFKKAVTDSEFKQ